MNFRRIVPDPLRPDLVLAWNEGDREIVGIWRPQQSAKLDRILAEGSLTGNSVLSLRVGNFEQLLQPIPLLIFATNALPFDLHLAVIDPATELNIRLTLNGKRGSVSFWFERTVKESR